MIASKKKKKENLLVLDVVLMGTNILIDYLTSVWDGV